MRMKKGHITAMEVPLSFKVWHVSISIGSAAAGLVSVVMASESIYNILIMQ